MCVHLQKPAGKPDSSLDQGALVFLGGAFLCTKIISALVFWEMLNQTFGHIDSDKGIWSFQMNQVKTARSPQHVLYPC